MRRFQTICSLRKCVECNCVEYYSQHGWLPLPQNMIQRMRHRIYPFTCKKCQHVCVAVKSRDFIVFDFQAAENFGIVIGQNEAGHFLNAHFHGNYDHEFCTCWKPMMEYAREQIVIPPAAFEKIRRAAYSLWDQRRASYVSELLSLIRMQFPRQLRDYGYC